MTDHLENLLNKKQSFEAQYQDINGLIHKIKQQNDSLQRDLEDMENDHLIQVTQQQEQWYVIAIIFYESKKSLDTMNQLLLKLEKSANGFEQKRQVKVAKQFLLKETERNRQILRDLLKKSTIQNNDDHYREEENIFSKSKVAPMEHQLLHQEQMHIDLSHQIIKERQQDVDHLEEQSQSLNKIVNELGIKVDEQDQQLDIITHDLVQAKNNVQLANQEVTEANQLQMERKKKYYIILFFVTILALGIISTVCYQML